MRDNYGMEMSEARIGAAVESGHVPSGVTVGLRVRYTAPGMIYHYGTVVGITPVHVGAFGASGRKMVKIGDDYRVQFEDGFAELVSDLRQRCWTVAA
jgi:hypothetical protein